MILDIRRITIREVADNVGISFGSCQLIFTDILGMKRSTADIVSKLLNFVQKQHRLDISQEMLTTFNDNHSNGKRFATIEKIKDKSKQELTLA